MTRALLLMCVWLLMSGCGHAQTKSTAPSWPEQAELGVTRAETLQNLQPSQAELNAELRLGRPYEISLRWPEAKGVVRYRVFKNKEEVATLKVTAEAHPGSWSSTVQGAFTWSVIAEDGQGKRSAALVAETEAWPSILKALKAVDEPGPPVDTITGSDSNFDALEKAFESAPETPSSQPQPTP